LENREEFLFWRLAHYFISSQGYRIIQLFNNQQELWLEKIENKHTPVIRLLRYNIDWSNRMQRDMEIVGANGEKIRKTITRGELKVLNIYVSAHPPIGEYEHHINKPYIVESSKTKIDSVLLTRVEETSAFQQLSSKYGQEISFPLEENYSSEDVETVKQSALSSAITKEKAEKAILSNGKPALTYFFIILQVMVYIFLEFKGGSTNTSTLIKYGAKFNPLILDGEWWRFITPIFLHIGFLHLIMNTLALYYLGTAVERIYGNFRFLFIYLFAGLSGSIASFIFSPNLSAGASGAIFGCFGALLYFSVIYPKLFFRTMGINIFVVLAINLSLGFTMPGIDNAGHIGGLVGGFLATGIVHFPKKKKLWLQFLFVILSLAIVISSLVYGFTENEHSHDESSILVLAQEYIKEEDYDKAYSLLKENADESKEKSSAEVYFLLSFSEIKKGMIEEAKTHLLTVIDKDPEFHEALFNLALIYLEENDLAKAKDFAERAAGIEPNRNEYGNLVTEINTYLKSADGE
jgi:rhomboid protease GluP